MFLDKNHSASGDRKRDDSADCRGLLFEGGPLPGCVLLFHLAAADHAVFFAKQLHDRRHGFWENLSQVDLLAFEQYAFERAHEVVLDLGGEVDLDDAVGDRFAHQSWGMPELPCSTSAASVAAWICASRSMSSRGVCL